MFISSFLRLFYVFFTSFLRLFFTSFFLQLIYYYQGFAWYFCVFVCIGLSCTHLAPKGKVYIIVAAIRKKSDFSFVVTLKHGCFCSFCLKNALENRVGKTSSLTRLILENRLNSILLFEAFSFVRLIISRVFYLCHNWRLWYFALFIIVLPVVKTWISPAKKRTIAKKTSVSRACVSIRCG